MAFTTNKLCLGLLASAIGVGSAFAQADTERGVLYQDAGRYTLGAIEPVTERVATEAPDGPTAGAQANVLFEEDFSDGLDGWTVVANSPVDTALWIYRDPSNNPLNDTLGGRFTGVIFDAPTAENGFAMIHYDSFATNGGANGVPAVLPVVDQDLVSPAIDMTTAEGVQAIEFHMYYRYCCNAAANLSFVSFSADGGATFENEVQIAPDLGVNTTYGGFRRDANDAPTGGAVNLIRIPEEYNGQSDVRIRFSYRGEFYALAIDDIVVQALPATELQINPDFIGIAESFITPESQVGDAQNIFFVTDIVNRGADTKSPRLAVTISQVIEGPNNDILYYTDTLDYPALEGDEGLENFVFEEFVGMPTEPGSYLGRYNLLPGDGTEDFLPDNNSTTFRFNITAADIEARYVKSPVLRNATRPADATAGEYEIGNVYYTPNLGTQGVRVDSVEVGWLTIGFDDTPVPAFWEVRTYGYRGDLNDDGVPNIGEDGIDDEDTELVRLGTRFFEIDPGTPRAYRDTVIAPMEEGEPEVILTPESGFIGYAIGMYYIQADSRGETEDFFWVGVDNQYNVGARGLVIDSLLTRNIIDDAEQYQQFFSIPLAETPATGYDWGSRTPFINSRMTMLDSVTSIRTTLDVNVFELTPNPADANVQVAFDFANDNGAVVFDLTNGLGQQVARFERATVANGNLTIPTAAYNSGVYFLTARDQEGRTATKRLVISH